LLGIVSCSIKQTPPCAGFVFFSAKKHGAERVLLRRNGYGVVWQTVELKGYRLQIRLASADLAAFLINRTTINLQNLPSLSRILASILQVRQAAREGEVLRSGRFK